MPLKIFVLFQTYKNWRRGRGDVVWQTKEGALKTHRH